MHLGASERTKLANLSTRICQPRQMSKDEFQVWKMDAREDDEIGANARTLGEESVLAMLLF